MTEYFAQGDQEKAEGLPISNLCDRDTVDIPKSQIGFIEVIIEPLYSALAPIIDVSEIRTTLADNKERWRAMIEEQQKMKLSSYNNRRRWSTSSLVGIGGILSQFPLESPEQTQKRLLIPTKTITRDDFFPSAQFGEDDEEAEKYIIHPEGAFKLIWDITSMVIIFIQAILTPYQVAFDSNEVVLCATMETFVGIFFTVDIVINFNTAFYHGGVVISSRREIALNYFKFWFWIDLIATIPYQTLLDIVNGEQLFMKSCANQSATALIRILKFFRIMKLIRLAKLKKILIEIEDYISSHNCANFFILVRLVIFTFIVAHWLACLWYTIGNSDAEDHPRTWLHKDSLIDEEQFVIYVTAVYWALTTMTTVGYGEIIPVTDSELVFTIIAMVVACALFAYTVGSISGIISKQSEENSIHRERVVALNAYMKERDLPNELRFRVRRYLDYIWETERKAFMDEKELLSLLSEPLREEIFNHTRGMLFKTCQIFSSFHKQFLLHFSKLFEPKTYAPGDIIFEEGEKTASIYYIQRGIAEILHQKTQSIFKELTTDGYFGEIALFTNKPRCATARCLEFVESLTVDRSQLASLLERMPDAKQKVDLIEKFCADDDYTILSINCYLCEKLGHVASKCPNVVINLNNEQTRNKWISSRAGPTKLVSGKDAELGMVKVRKNKVFPLGGFQGIRGYNREPGHLYQDIPGLSKKARKYLASLHSKNEDSPSSIRDDIVRRARPRFSILLNDSDSSDHERDSIGKEYKFDTNLLGGPMINSMMSESIGDELADIVGEMRPNTTRFS